MARVPTREAAPRPGHGVAREQSRARYPDATGHIERDGVRVHWERYGDGHPTILLMPTWSVFHSRHWKLQIPYLARHFRVVTFDGRGNGRSDRPPTAAAYADTEFVADALEVLDATGTDRAVVAGLSMGAGYALRLAAERPDRVLGAVFIGSSIPIGPRDPERAAEGQRSFDEPRPDDGGWARYNAHFWRRDWPGFAAWFAGKIFSERHSTKQIEDAVGWFLETDPETIITKERAPYLEPPTHWEQRPDEPAAMPFIRRVRCRTLVIHGDDDRISTHAVAERLAAALDAPLVTIAGGGHSPIGRHPVLVNRLIRDFIESLPDVTP
jgi:pimeloyl-ACP methyl ester carboxylesterase